MFDGRGFFKDFGINLDKWEREENEKKKILLEKEIEDIYSEKKRVERKKRMDIFNSITKGIFLDGSGVYEIYNNKLNFVYVGSTGNFKKRLRTHIRIKNKLTEKELEDDDTKFKILEKINSKEIMLRREGAWIRYFSNFNVNLKNKVYDPYLEYLVSKHKYTDKRLNITMIHKNNIVVFDKERIDNIYAKEDIDV